MRPFRVVSSANFRSLTEGSLDVQSFMYREKSSGERTQPWGAPVLIVRVLDENFPSFTSCCLSIRKAVDPLTDRGGDGELYQFILKGVRDDDVKGGAEVYKQDLHISPWSVQMLQDEVQSHFDCIIHRPVCSVGKPQRGPVRVQCCPSDKPNQSFKWFHDHSRQSHRFVVIKSCSFGFLWDGDDGGAFEAWGDFAQLQGSVEDLCEDGASWSAQRYKSF